LCFDSLPTGIEFVGMTDYISESFHNLFTGQLEAISYSNSSGQSHHPSLECSMADHPEGTSKASMMETLPRTSPMMELGRETKPHRTCGWSSYGSSKRSLRRHAFSWSRNMPNSSTRSDAAKAVGAHAPTPAMSTEGFSKTTREPHSSPGQARTSLTQRFYSKDSQNLRRPRRVTRTTSCGRSLSERCDNRKRARCLSDVGPMPASTLLRCGMSRMFPSTKPHARERVPHLPPFKDASAPTATRASPSMPISVGMKTSRWWQAEGITLTAADATTALRTLA
jgi:hypothetical protein